MWRARRRRARPPGDANAGGGCQRIERSDLGGDDDSDDDDSAVVVPADGTDARGDRTGSGSGAGGGDGNVSARVDVELQRERCESSGGWGEGGQGRVATRGATVDRRDDGVDGTTRYKKPRCLRAATGDRCARLKTHPNVEEGGGAGGETEGGPKQSLLTNDGHTRSCVRRRERLRRLPRRTRFSHRPTRRVSEFGYCRNRATDVRPIPFIPTDFSFPKGWHSCAYRHTRARLPRVTR